MRNTSKEISNSQNQTSIERALIVATIRNVWQVFFLPFSPESVLACNLRSGDDDYLRFCEPNRTKSKARLNVNESCKFGLCVHCNLSNQPTPFVFYYAFRYLCMSATVGLSNILRTTAERGWEACVMIVVGWAGLIIL